jgi:heat shock protein HslJ
MSRQPRHVLNLLIAAGIAGFAAPSLLAGNDPDSYNEFANARYQGIEGASVQLEDGRWEGELYAPGGASRPAVGLVEHFVLNGDLDGDGEIEAVVLLWQSSGGSGTFDHVAVMKKVDGDWLNVATAPLGDRVQVRGGAINDGAVRLDVVQQGEGDAACCPSQLASRNWTLAGDRLTEQESRIDGVLSLSVLEGTEWVLTRLPQDHHLPEGAEVTVGFAEGRIAGDSGCNRFSAGLTGGEIPGEVKIGPAMGTRMACPEDQMNLEAEFLDLLGHVNQFSFVAGQLVLSGSKETYSYALRFRSR